MSNSHCSRLVPLLAGALLASLAVVCATVFVASARGGSSRIQTCYNPSAYVPPVNTSTWQSRGEGGYWCEWSADYTVRLYNNSGDTLAQSSGTTYDQFNFVFTSYTGCRGAVLKSWVYRNSLGAGASDTSGTTDACAY